ncbi:hypothetical protein T02_1598 [Trichinella nativa]|uniref:Uncharacterized protein n=1 Tax=Trichinella nativa TaxID=6335 RepID=A0A0V1KUJ3_9BILA|nr:hypothetical protein T02_1598 [Trichinella nativa]
MVEAGPNAGGTPWSWSRLRRTASPPLLAFLARCYGLRLTAAFLVSCTGKRMPFTSAVATATASISCSGNCSCHFEQDNQVIEVQYWYSYQQTTPFSQKDEIHHSYPDGSNSTRECTELVIRSRRRDTGATLQSVQAMTEFCTETAEVLAVRNFDRTHQALHHTTVPNPQSTSIQFSPEVPSPLAGMVGSKSIPTASSVLSNGRAFINSSNGFLVILGQTTHFVTTFSVGYSKVTNSGSQRLTYMAMQPLWDFYNAM